MRIVSLNYIQTFYFNFNFFNLIICVSILDLNEFIYLLCTYRVLHGNICHQFNVIHINHLIERRSFSVRTHHAIFVFSSSLRPKKTKIAWCVPGFTLAWGITYDVTGKRWKNLEFNLGDGWKPAKNRPPGCISWHIQCTNKHIYIAGYVHTSQIYNWCTHIQIVINILFLITHAMPTITLRLWSISTRYPAKRYHGYHWNRSIKGTFCDGWWDN